MLPGASPIFDALNSNFTRIFGEPKVTHIEVIPIITSQEEQYLDPASQTGDFVLPVGDIFLKAIEQVETEQETAEAERHYRDLDESNGVDDDSFDLTHEEVRIYHFADGVEVEVENPHTLTIGVDGTHYITPFDRVGVEIPPRWIKLEVFPKQGEACFDGHPPVNEIA